MTRLALCFLVFFIPILNNAQEREERNIGSFDEIKVGQAIKVFLHYSNDERVVIESNVDLDEVETRVDNGRLRISLDGDRYVNISVRVDVYYRSLRGIYSSSASSVKSDEVIKGDDFTVDVSSAAYVDLKLDVYDLEVEVSSAGDAKLAGKAHEIDVSVSSAGDVDAYELNAEMVKVSASSAGSAKVYVTKSLHARASSGGSIKYKGRPERSNSDSSSGGSIKRSN